MSDSSIAETTTDRCWICNAPATTTCPQCGQGVCQAHLQPIPEAYTDVFGPEGCEVCVRRTLKDLGLFEKDRRPVLEPPLPERTCAFDGVVYTHALPKCEVCGRQVCAAHRYRYRRKLYVGSENFKSAYYWEYKVRCRDHPWRWYRLRGWELLTEEQEQEDPAYHENAHLSR